MKWLTALAVLAIAGLTGLVLFDPATAARVATPPTSTLGNGPITVMPAAPTVPTPTAPAPSPVPAPASSPPPSVQTPSSQIPSEPAGVAPKPSSGVSAIPPVVDDAPAPTVPTAPAPTCTLTQASPVYAGQATVNVASNQPNSEFTWTEPGTEQTSRTGPDGSGDFIASVGYQTGAVTVSVNWGCSLTIAP